MFFLSDAMKSLIVFSLALATVAAKDLYPRSIMVPVLENEGRITNGKKANPGQFYYQVGLSLRKGIDAIWCSGSLIGHTWVLTAAHCTHGVYAGRVYLGATQRLVAEQEYDAVKGDFITHPDWNSDTLKNDIALIRIQEISESSRIGIVRIPSKYDNNTYIGFFVFISGWGTINDNSDLLTNDLLYGILKVSPGSVCSKVFRYNYNDNIHICVATPNKVASCDHDSGGPLVLEGQMLQIGVYSFGSDKGCTLGFPDIFTRVSAYLPWIKTHTGIDY